MRVIMFGSRVWSDDRLIWADLLDLYELGYRALVHGACPSGADYFADVQGLALGFTVERHRARWREYEDAGKPVRQAGPDRNEHMASLGADIAFGYRLPDERGQSRGTDDMARACTRHEIPLVKRGVWL